MTNDLKLKIYPAVIAVLGLGLTALLMSRVEIQIANQPDRLLDGPLDRPLDGPLQPSPATRPVTRPSPATRPAAQPRPQSAAPSASAPAPASAPAVPVGADGGLRVSNQTDYPVRVALMYQQRPTTKSTQPQFGQPVHWDFAPAEGGGKGLMLSLPTGGLRLTGGDVLVAFAQDGSRRYWGPYVVGKTELPIWSSEQREWLLLLR